MPTGRTRTIADGWVESVPEILSGMALEGLEEARSTRHRPTRRQRAAAARVAGDFAGHPPRRGFITRTAKKVPHRDSKRVTRQRSGGIVLGYVAAATLGDDPPLPEIVSARARA